MLEKLLYKVQKPARYAGGELGSARKDPKSVKIRYAFCFPDVYEVGMSHLGMKILYHMMNEREDTFCERVFAPWPDMEALMREHSLPLFALESRDALSEFDIVGFTLQYEMCYTNVVNMLELGKITLMASERREGEPFVFAGGPCAFNPAPLSAFIDLFVIGEGEEVSIELLDLFNLWRESGAPRGDFLKAASEIEGVYVPAFPKPRVKKRIIKDLDKAYYPENIIVPFMEIVHDRAVLEVFRGCIRGCRFCQAGFIYRPARERGPERLCKISENLIESTGYDELSLSSLSTSDYTRFFELTDKLLPLGEERGVNLALPSLRVDNLSLGLMEKVQKRRKSSLTLAPEAGTQRMRDVINKGITKEDIKTSARLAFAGGWSSIKLYFMIGLPFETDEDVAAIAHLAKEIVDIYYLAPKEKRSRGLRLSVSVSPFVPKPFTPFQWVRMDSPGELGRKVQIIRDNIKSKQISLSWHGPSLSLLEGVFARGDERLSNVLLAAQRRGLKFDGWSEYFDYARWLAAFEECGISPDEYTRAREADEELPWDFIDCGVSKKFLALEYERAARGETTENCRRECTGCGAASWGAGVCNE